MALPDVAGAKPGKAKLDLKLERTPIIVKNSYRKLPPIGGRGAMGRNLNRRGFSLAHQHLGDVYVRAGIVRKQPRLIRKGLRAFDYAFRRQRSDGSFPESQAEGYAFFVEAVAHSMLLMNRTSYKRQFKKRTRHYKKRLRRAAKHMLVPSAWKGFKGRNPHYTHSGFSTGTALALTGKLVRSKQLQRYGRRAVRLALRNQRDTGANPELGGYDVRYHMAGITYAQRYRVYFPGGRVKRGIERMTRRGLKWMDRRIARNGYINWRGSSRTCRERNSDGNLKTPGYSFAVRGFAYWGALKKRRRLLDLSRRIDPYPGAAGGRPCGPRKAVAVQRPRRKREQHAAGAVVRAGAPGGTTQARMVRASVGAVGVGSGSDRASDGPERELAAAAARPEPGREREPEAEPERAAGPEPGAEPERVAEPGPGTEREPLGAGERAAEPEAGAGPEPDAERDAAARGRARDPDAGYGQTERAPERWDRPSAGGPAGRREEPPPSPPLVLGGAVLAVALGARVRARQRRRRFMFASRRRRRRPPPSARRRAALQAASRSRPPERGSRRGHGRASESRGRRAPQATSRSRQATSRSRRPGGR